MRIEERKMYHGIAAIVYPFDSEDCASITASAEPVSDVLLSPARYRVNWPAIGSVDTATTRLFAQALLAAADWVDEQKAKQEAALRGANPQTADSPALCSDRTADRRGTEG